MKSGHSFWAKFHQARNAIDVESIFNEYWGSDKHEFVLSGQYSRSPANRFIANREAQRILC
jgi:hypothetical protein